MNVRGPVVEGVELAHWGAVNGRNQWRDCETVAIVGLPYLDHATPINIALGLLGSQSDEWLQSADKRAYGEHHDVVSAIQTGHIAASVLQAINRVRCRKVVDSQGNCARTSVFIMLPLGNVADQLTDCISRSMPGVQFAGWDLDLSRRTPGSLAAQRRF